MTSQEIPGTPGPGDTPPGTPTPGGTPGGSKLDNASKEDLIKLLKKQQIALRKHQAEATAFREKTIKQVAAVRSELNTANEQVTVYKCKNDKLLEELDNVEDVTQEEIQELQREINSLKNEREDYVSELETLRHNKENMRTILQTSAAQQDESQLKLNTLTQQLEDEVREREEEREGWKCHIHELEMSLRQKESDENKVALETDLMQSKADISSLRNEGEQLKSMMLEYNKQFLTETQTLSQALQLLNNPGLMRRREDLEEELNTLKEQLALSTTHLLSKDDELSSLTSQLNTLDEATTQSSLLSEQLSAELEVIRGSSVGYVAENEGLRRRVDELEQSQQNHLEEMNVCQKELEDLVEKKISEVKVLEMEVEKCKKSIEILQTTEQRGDTTEKTLFDQLGDKLVQERKIMEEERKTMDEHLCKIREDKISLEETVATSQEMINELEKRIRDAERRREEEERRRRELVDEVKGNEEVIQEMRESNQHLTEEREKEKNMLEERIAIVNEEKRNLQLHMESFLQENDTLKEQSQESEELALVEDREVYSQALIAKDEDLAITREDLAIAREDLAITRQQLCHLEDELLALQTVSNTEKESTAQSIEQLQSQINGLEEEMSHLEDVREEEKAELHSQIFLMEEQINKLHTELETSQLRASTLEQSIESTTLCLEEKEGEIVSLREELASAIDKNNSLVEDTKGSHNLMDMELADYQRAITSLEEKIKSIQQSKEELESDLKRKEELLAHSVSDVKQLEKQRSQLDEMITKLKALLIKTKKESADCKRSEEEMRRVAQGTRKELEFSNQKLEEIKLELCEVTSQLSSVTETSRLKAEENMSVIRSLEHRMSALQEDIVRERKVREEISSDFDSYKVRVHSVLKQQKTKESVISSSEHDAITSQLSREAELAKCQLHEAKMLEELLSEERDSLEQELSSVINKLDKLEKESTERETFYLEKFVELENCLKEKEVQLSNAVQSAVSQRTSLTHSYTKTIEHANLSHKEAVQMLQERIEQLQTELRTEQESSRLTEEHSHQETERANTIESLRGSIRLGAEGMESPGPAPTQPFEDLLNSSSYSRSSSRVSLGGESNNNANTPTMEECQTSHLTKLLTESEHSAAALHEQCTVLKEEIRRNERMLGREDTNLEYLKNIVLKFLCADITAREHLVPVLCTVLKLSREEKILISNTATIGKREAVPWGTGWFSSS